MYAPMKSRRRLRLVGAGAAPHSASLWPDTGLLMAAVFAALLLLHAPLLPLPYFWDEAGYYVPAARDLLLTGALVPHSTAANSHPPLVLATLALAWKLAGMHPVVTRITILLWAAFGLCGLYQLARRIAHPDVAAATLGLTALYPVFFSQSVLAHLDLAAAALTFWGLYFYFSERRALCATVFSLAVLAKETAVLAPLALLVFELFAMKMKMDPGRLRPGARSAWLLLPIVPLALWFIYLHARTGHWLGDPGYVQYNVADTLSPVRFLLALVQRLWQLTGHMGLLVLTAAMLLALFFPPLPEDFGAQRGRVLRMPEPPLRGRIEVRSQLALAAVIAAYVLAMSVVGGALLARYLLPVVPLFILIAVSTLRRRVPAWPWVCGIVAAGFAIALFVNPPYTFAPEDNLAWRSFVALHQEAADILEARDPAARVLTAWPATDELARPYLGYVRRPMRVTAIENFSVTEIQRAAGRTEYDAALVFSTKHAPARGSLLDAWPAWRHAHERYFGLHQDLPPELIAEWLHGRIVWQAERSGQWAAIIEFPRVVNAKTSPRIGTEFTDSDSHP